MRLSRLIVTRRRQLTRRPRRKRGPPRALIRVQGSVRMSGARELQQKAGDPAYWTKVSLARRNIAIVAATWRQRLTRGRTQAVARRVERECALCVQAVSVRNDGERTRAIGRDDRAAQSDGVRLPLEGNPGSPCCTTRRLDSDPPASSIPRRPAFDNPSRDSRTVSPARRRITISLRTSVGGCEAVLAGRRRRTDSREPLARHEPAAGGGEQFVPHAGMTRARPLVQRA